MRYLEDAGISQVRLSLEGEIMGCNAAFMRLLGLGEEPIGRSLSEWLLPGSQDALRRLDLAPGQETPLDLLLAGENDLIEMDARVSRLAECVLLLGRRAILTDEQVLVQMSTLNNELINLTRELKRKNLALEEAQRRIETLSGLIPICASCKKVRDDRGYWTQVEAYVSEHSNATFSHGICPDCMHKLYGDLIGDEDLQEDEE